MNKNDTYEDYSKYLETPAIKYGKVRPLFLAMTYGEFYKHVFQGFVSIGIWNKEQADYMYEKIKTNPNFSDLC